MNKMTLLLIIGLLSIVYVAYQIFISDEPVPTSDNNITISNIEVIKPIDIVDKSKSEFDQLGGFSEKQSNIDDGQQSKYSAQQARKTNREKLIELKNTKNINYQTLGEMIENIQSQDVTSDDVMVNLDRIKHNVEIAKQMAELTKNLHVEIDGTKEMDHEVFEKLLEIQKGIILPSNNLSFSSEK